MSNMNLFGWLREGVRQSVLLGVSDAVEQLGTPASTEELHPSVAGFLRVDGENATPKVTGSSGGSRGGRKRLGKSLKEIGNESNKK